jgi:hypothetical protein
MTGALPNLEARVMKDGRADRIPDVGRSRTAITALVCRTHERPDALNRAIRSFAPHCRRRDRATRVIVADNSPDPAARARCRAMLHTIAAEQRLEIAYVGAEEKARYIERAVAEQPAWQEQWHTALLDIRRSGLDPLGASFNALLLDTAGEMVAAIDDDSIGRVAVANRIHVEGTEGTANVSVVRIAERLPGAAAHPQQVWVMKDEAEALAHVQFTEENFLEVHERLLGAAVRSVGTDPPVHQDGTVVATFTGLLGDSAWASPTFFFLLTGASAERFARRFELGDGCRTRVMIKTVTQPTLVRGCDNMMTTFFALDNRGTTPPFLPVGRGEDNLYGVTMSCLHHDGWFGYLPRLLPHWPLEQRRFWPGELARSTSGIGLTLLMATLIEAWNRTAPPDPSGRYENCGRYLQEVASCSGGAFIAWVHPLVERFVDALVGGVLQRTEHVRAPGRWKETCRTLADDFRVAARDVDFAVPLDCRIGRSRACAADLTATLVRDFGRLIEWWPRGREVARRLNERGVRLAQPV